MIYLFIAGYWILAAIALVWIISRIDKVDTHEEYEDTTTWD